MDAFNEKWQKSKDEDVVVFFQADKDRSTPALRKVSKMILSLDVGLI
jgi:hypothetical protein